MEPSKGRIVLYRMICDERHPESETVPALITKVAEDGRVGLTCFMQSGFFFRKNVEQGDGEGQWHWPPRT